VALQQVAILGLGLIGASLGLALKRDPSPPRVVGFDIRSESLRSAARSGAIDRSCGTLPEVCRGSDVVVLAAPVQAILELIPEIGPHLSEGTLVTDMGGTKSEIVRVAETALPPGVGFVGGHPLTGRLTVGVGQASASLYPGARYCLTPSATTPDWAVERAIELVERVGAQPLFLDPDEHDALLAAASHLPYFTSVALFGAVAAQKSWPDIAGLAAGGFRSVASLVDADPVMWADVAASNREHIVRQLDELISHLQQLRESIEADDGSLMRELQSVHERHRVWIAGQQNSANPPASAPSTDEGRRGGGWVDRFRRG
jgi:prephenate dehydrogenase